MLFSLAPRLVAFHLAMQPPRAVSCVVARPKRGLPAPDDPTQVRSIRLVRVVRRARPEIGRILTPVFGGGNGLGRDFGRL